MNNKSNTSIYRRATSVGVLCIALLGSVAFASVPERVIYLKNTTDLSPVNKLLAEGWTIKHQNCAEGTHGRSSMLFTLTPPSAEALAENEAKRKAELERKRAEFLAKKNQAVEAR
jgi:hypothetical protein